MKLLGHLAALFFLTIWTVGQASATTYDPFTVSGVFTDQFKDTFTLNGSLDVDASSGTLANASLRLVGEPWTQIVSQGSVGGFYDISIQTPVLNAGCTSSSTGPRCHDTLNLVLSANPLMLLQNHGGSIISGFAQLVDAGFQINLVSGTLSAATTPLPSTLPLFGAGLGVLGFFHLLRRRQLFSIQP